MTRLGFLKGLAAMGLGGFSGRAFAAPPGWKPKKAPALVFGVLSDTHLRTSVNGDELGANWTDRYFIAALEYFKAQNVDAVVHCGDFAHRGQVREMEFHAEAWKRVFPDDRASDGRDVVKLFITGNHDVEGGTYEDFVANRYPDPEERAKHVLATDLAGHWERIWGEKYEPVWHKVVKGHHFFGINWAVEDTAMINLLSETQEECDSDSAARPVFMLSHTRPQYDLRKALAEWSNPVAFFGHNHWSVTNWNTFKEYYGKLACVQCASCEPRGCTKLVDDGWISKVGIEGADQTGSGRQGFVVRVYDDMVVIERREFGEGGSLGADWVLPLNTRNPHPFSRDELVKAIGEPQFRDGAKLKVEVVGSSDASSASVNVSIPRADGNPDSRVYAYEVVFSGGDANSRVHKCVYASGVNLAMGREPNGGVTELSVPLSELPSSGKLAVAVRPISSLGTRGRAIGVSGVDTAA